MLTNKDDEYYSMDYGTSGISGVAIILNHKNFEVSADFEQGVVYFESSVQLQPLCGCRMGLAER